MINKLKEKNMFKYFAGFIGILLFISVFSVVFGWCNQAVDVVKQEFGPKELLRKYEWFKDASAAIDEKVATIEMYKTRQKSMEVSYAGTLRKNWDRTDKEQYNQWIQEVAGMIASYNATCAEYNSQMSKFNWRFTNAGDLPDGATKVLPREYKPYVLN